MKYYIFSGHQGMTGNPEAELKFQRADQESVPTTEVSRSFLALWASMRATVLHWGLTPDPGKGEEAHM